MTIWLTHIAGWTRKATNTHSEYVILIAFPLQQWSYERPLSVTSYVHIPVLLGVKPGDTLSDHKASNSKYFNSSTPNDHYSGRTAPLTSKRCILYIYSTNIGTEYFKHGI